MIIKRLIREIIRAPGLNLTVILLVAIGVGSSAAIFAIVRPVLLRPLPFPRSHEIVTLWENDPDTSQLQVSSSDLEDIRARARALSELASYRFWSVTLSGRGPAEQLHGARVSSEFFRVLGIHPFLGREFTPQEFLGRQQFVLISYQLWQQRFGSDPNIRDQYIKLGGTAYSIVGVMPPGFDFPSGSSPTQVWAPLLLSSADLGNRGNHNLQVIGRLRSGLSVQEAQKEVSAIAMRIAEEHPETNSKVRATLTLLQSELNGPYRPGLLVLLGGSMLIVLISCANNSALLLAKGIGQQDAMIIRKALGATEVRIIRERLYESLFLSLVGAALGLLLAKVCLTVGQALIHNMPSSDQIRIDPVVVAFALIVSVGSAVLFSIVPAFRAASVTDLSSALRGSIGLRTREARRVQAVLVVSETALALVLLVAAGLLLRTMVRIWSVPVGFNPDNILTMSFSLPQAGYPTAARQAQFFRDVLANAGHLPGVKGVALGSPLPWQGEIGVGFQVEGKPNPSGGFQADLVICSPDFFNVLEVPLVRGRGLTIADASKSVQVAVINQVMASRFWNGQDPIGKLINIEGAGKREIVGIVADFHQSDFMEPPQPAIFVPYAQSPTPYAGIVLRSASDPAHLTDLIRTEIGRVDPDVAPASYHTLRETLRRSVEQQSFVMALLTSFAAIALALATIGSYGFIARMVALRRREFAVRVAVGASASSILRLVLGRGMFLIAIGCVLGIVGSLAVTRLLSSFLWGIKATDPVTYLLAVLGLFSVNLLALYRPARGSMRVSPAEILREE